jgi:signal transduction histidine kinase
MRLKLILFLLFILPFYAISALPENSLQKKPNFTEATAYYNYCNQLFNYLQVKGKFTDFQKLLKSAKKGLSITKPNDFKNLAGLQFLTGMAHKIYLKPDSGLYYLNLSISNAQRGNELDIEISGIQQINYLYRYLGKVEETDRYVKRLNVLYKELKDIYLRDKVISALSDDFLHRGAYTQAVELLLGSLTTKEYLYKQKRDYKSRINLGLAFSELGSLYLQLNQNQNALSFLNKGEPYFFDYIGGRVRLYRKMQQAYLNLSKIDSATIYYEKIYGVMQINVYESAEDISSTNRLFAEYYLLKQNIPKAIKYAKIAYDNAMVCYSKETILLAVNMMGNLRYQEQKYQEAIAYFEKALPNSHNFSKDVFASINLKLAQSYEQLRSYKKANLFYNKYNLLRDNIYLEKTREDLNIIEFKYKTAQKEQRINFLNIQGKIQEKELIRQKQYKTILIISVLLVLTIAVLIFFNFKNKQTANLLLDKKNQQLDIVNSQLSMANQTKTKLFSIISHDLRSPVSQLFTFLRIQHLNPKQISEEEKVAHQQKLMASAGKLLTTMEDLLLWSKSQLENFELALEEIDIHQLLEESISQMQNQADANNVEIKIGDVQLNTMQSDQNLLFIVLRNLLQNAINHTYNHTSILVNTGFDEEKKPFISIINKGDILSQEKIEELLNSQNVESKSSGYGLVIVKELLQKLSGTLNIKSSLEGTEINISFS